MRQGHGLPRSRAPQVQQPAMRSGVIWTGGFSHMKRTYSRNARAVLQLGVGLLVAASSSSFSSVARAEPASASPPATAADPPVGQWYGWQTLLGIAGAHALF